LRGKHISGLRRICGSATQGNFEPRLSSESSIRQWDHRIEASDGTILKGRSLVRNKTEEVDVGISYYRSLAGSEFRDSGLYCLPAVSASAPSIIPMDDRWTAAGAPAKTGTCAGFRRPKS
jgi:hypothetical protein